MVVLTGAKRSFGTSSALAPAKTSADIVDKLNEAIVKVLNLPEVRARLAEQGFQIAAAHVQHLVVAGQHGVDHRLIRRTVESIARHRRLGPRRARPPAAREQAHAEEHVRAPDARGKGVLIVMNDEINGARDVTKTNTYRVETFRAPELGFLGYVDADKVSFYRASTRRHTANSEFDISSVRDLPQVDVVYSYVEPNTSVFQALVAMW